MAFNKWAVQKASNDRFVIIRYDSGDNSMWGSEPLWEKEAVSLLEEMGIAAADISKALQSAKSAVA